MRWWPSGVKFSGASQAWKRARMGGHSVLVMENQAVSRFWPFTTMWLRKVPSWVKPKRSAARREGALAALQRHCQRR